MDADWNMFLAIVAKLLTSASWSNPRPPVLKGLPAEVWLVYYHSGPANAERTPRFCNMTITFSKAKIFTKVQMSSWKVLTTPLSDFKILLNFPTRRFAFKTLDPQKYYVTTLQVRLICAAGIWSFSEKQIPLIYQVIWDFHCWRQRNPSE